MHAMHATAGGGDAYTRLQIQKQQQGGPRDSRVTGPIKAKLPALRPPTPPSKIEGLVVPAHPNQQAHMAMLLNQQPGKLMLTDIQVLRAILLVYPVGACCSWTTLHAWHLLPMGLPVTMSCKRATSQCEISCGGRHAWPYHSLMKTVLLVVQFTTVASHRLLLERQQKKED